MTHSTQKDVCYPLPDGYSMDQYYPEILNALKTRLTLALEKRSRVLLVRLDFRYPQNFLDWRRDNYCFSVFMESYIQFKKDALLEYVWVREQAESEHCHWHTAFLFDGNKMRYFASPSHETRLWNTAIHNVFFIPFKQLPQWGLVESSPNMKNGIALSRDNPAMTEGALRIVSYLAKKETKDNMPYHVRKWSASHE